MGVGWKSNADVGTVSSVNGIAPDGGGDVSLTAADIPSDGPSDVQSDIDALEADLLSVVDTAISATTASLGEADVYRATAASITITVSSADIAAGRQFVFKARNAGVSVGTPVTIATEGIETIDGAASVDLVVDYGSVTLFVVGGNLESP